MSFLGFSIVASLIFAAINLYCFISLRMNSLLRNFKLILGMFFISVSVIEIAYFMSFNGYSLNAILYKIAIFCVGASFMLFCVLLSFDGAIFAASKFSRSRRALRFLLDIGVLIGAFSYIFKGFFNASDLVITRREIELKNLRRDRKFAVVSDIHIGEFLGKDFLEKIISKIRSIRPEAVFIVGDLADLKASKLQGVLEPLRTLSSEFETFFVAGNHEYYHGLGELLVEFSKLGIKILRNESVNLNGLNLAGSYDLAGLKFGEFTPDFTKTLANLDVNSPTILLTHQPKSLKIIASELLNKVDLVICGHTHAGQIFPFSLLVWLDQKYIYGLYEITNKTKLLVTSGAGFWGPPMRILSKSEIV